MPDSKEQKADVAVHINTSETLPLMLSAELKLHAVEFMASAAAESLHQIRVTLRKIRALFSIDPNSADELLLATAKDTIRWLSELTGPARDADVQLKKELEAGLTLPPSVRNHLELQKKEAYPQIIAALSTPRFADLLAAVAQIKTEDESDKTAEVLQNQIQKLLKRVFKKGPRLDRNSPDKDFHELRKTLKKLRYTYGFFFLNTDTRQQKKIEKQLKLIQEFLGQFQDLTVSIEHLTARATTLIVNQDTDRQELFDLGFHLGESKKQIEAMKADFPAVFKRFERAMTKKNKQGKHHQEL